MGDKIFYLTLLKWTKNMEILLTHIILSHMTHISTNMCIYIIHTQKNAYTYPVWKFFPPKYTF